MIPRHDICHKLLFSRESCYHYYFDVFKIMLIMKKINTQIDDPLSSASESSVHTPKIFPYLQMLSFLAYPNSMSDTNKI